MLNKIKDFKHIADLARGRRLLIEFFVKKRFFYLVENFIGNLRTPITDEIFLLGRISSLKKFKILTHA